jgi:hypothetical protein
VQDQVLGVGEESGKVGVLGEDAGAEEGDLGGSSLGLAGQWMRSLLSVIFCVL